MKLLKAALFGAAIILLLTACTAGLLQSLLPGVGGVGATPTPFIPSTKITQRSNAPVPSVELYDGWKITPAMILANPACFTGIPGSVKPKATPVVLRSTGTCGTTFIRMTSLNRIVECHIMLVGSKFTVTNDGVDADCRARVIKARYPNAGAIKFVYQLKKKYRPHGPWNPWEGH